MTQADSRFNGHGRHSHEGGGRSNGLVRNVALVVLCVGVSALHPALLDFAKTATLLVVRRRHGGGTSTLEVSTYPFSAVSLAIVCDLVKLVVGVLVLCKREPLGVRTLWFDQQLVKRMAPLGFLYAFGELLALRAVEKGSGPLYVIISNLRLVIVAVITRALFGPSRGLPTAHWLQLTLISFLAAAYTLAEAGELGSQWQWEGACLAFAKCTLAALLAVVYERAYKSGGLIATVTLQVFWGLVAFFILVCLSFIGVAARGIALELVDDNGGWLFFHSGPRHPLCLSNTHARCMSNLERLPYTVLMDPLECVCITKKGWDRFTFTAVLADLVYAIATALVFKKLSAVTKYICVAVSAAPVYILSCLGGRIPFDLRVFALVLCLCVQVAAYTVQRHQAQTFNDKGEVKWTQHYSRPVSLPRRSV